MVVKRKISNKLIIDYIVVEYIINYKILDNINFIRRYKGIYLPIKVVEPEGKKIIDYYEYEEDPSLLK